MSDFVEHAPCENFEANVFAKSRCQNCFRAVAAHHQPSNQVSFSCDLEASPSTLPTHSDPVRTGRHLISSIGSLDSGVHEARRRGATLLGAAGIHSVG
uniref:Uncharacterized protein n=1 Tax=Chrysemys picta bellii TaxID=8478 RepID=A0A8C3IFM9_CHRPI